MGRRDQMGKKVHKEMKAWMDRKGQLGKRVRRGQKVWKVHMEKRVNWVHMGCLVMKDRLVR